jgi:dTDP-4-dehydrorhamnose 3,5-epimerase
MHLQLPPHDGRKLVFVTSGRIHDFVIDLRMGSPTFHNVWSDELTPVSMGVFIPAGCAHGFVTLEGDASVVYVQEGDHHVESDGGVNMSELELGYEIHTLTFSERDRALPLLGEFISPFMFEQ